MGVKIGLELTLVPLAAAGQVTFFALNVLVQYVKFCGWALARTHAQAGQPSLIAGYLGKGDQFDEAVADFAKGYAQSRPF